MPQLTEAGQGLIAGLTGETPDPAKTKVDDYVAPVADEGPPVHTGESSLQADPIDPETGEPIDHKTDESQLDPKELYKAKVHVDVDGESVPVTVGELKDMYSTLQGAKKTASENDRQRDEFAREQMLARQEFDAMVAMLPTEAVTDEFRARVSERIQNHTRAETARLLRVVPEWGDPQAADDDRRMINKHAAKYGFSADEISLISDHRMVKYLLDNARAEHRLGTVVAKQESAKAQKPTSKPGRANRDTNLADIKSAAREGRLTKREAAGKVLLEVARNQR